MFLGFIGHILVGIVFWLIQKTELDGVYSLEHYKFKVHIFAIVDSDIVAFLSFPPVCITKKKKCVSLKYIKLKTLKVTIYCPFDLLCKEMCVPCAGYELTQCLYFLL